MSSTPAIALSGMNAAQRQLQVHAHNIANLGTEGFRRTTPSGPATTPGPAIATDLVGQLVAKHHFLANLAVFKTSDRMTGALLDAVG